ncbi:Rib/alpha-like domain-containing protein [Eubacteriales bacterium KG125]
MKNLKRIKKLIVSKGKTFEISRYGKRKIAMRLVSCGVGASMLFSPLLCVSAQGLSNLGLDLKGSSAVQPRSLKAQRDEDIIKANMSTLYTPQQQPVLVTEKGKAGQSQPIKFVNRNANDEQLIDAPEGTLFKIDELSEKNKKLPTGITVDSKTGTIFVSKDVPAGEYDIDIKIGYKDGSSNGIALGVDVKEVKYDIPLLSIETTRGEYRVKVDDEIILDIIANPVNASEQRFHWSYSEEGLVEITDVPNADVENRTMHTAKGLKNGRVEVTGTPIDNTQGAKPIKFTVIVGEEHKKPESNNTGTDNSEMNKPEKPVEPIVENEPTKPEWKQSEDGFWYVEEKGEKKTGWFEDKDKYPGWYYFDENGKMQTGWLKLGNTWYYLKSSGAMATGWEQVGNTWYYLKSSGAMATGWLKLGNTWYYLKSSGAMATGWEQVGNTWYYLKSSGAMATGWEQVGNTWYYLKSSGAMATGWEHIGNTWYKFASSGAWIK